MAKIQDSTINENIQYQKTIISQAVNWDASELSNLMQTSNIEEVNQVISNIKNSLEKLELLIKIQSNN